MDEEVISFYRDRETERKARRAASMDEARREFEELAKIACTGDMTLSSPGYAHWILRRSQGRGVILQFWPSVSKVQMQGQKKSRHCTLAQFRAMLHDKLGCPPLRGED